MFTFKKLITCSKVITQKIITSLMFSLITLPAFAAETGSSMPWDSPLTKIQNALTGTTAHLAIVIAIAVAGLGFAFSPEGGVMRRAFSIVGGGSIATGAVSLYTTLGIGGALI